MATTRSAKRLAEARLEAFRADQVYSEMESEVFILNDMIRNRVPLDAPTVQKTIRNIEVLSNNWIFHKYAEKCLKGERR